MKKAKKRLPKKLNNGGKAAERAANVASASAAGLTALSGLVKDDDTSNVLGSAGTMAGTGASIGSAFGPWGTAIGAGAGAIAGTVMGIVGNNQAKKRKKQQQQLISKQAAAELEKVKHETTDVFSTEESAYNRAKVVNGTVQGIPGGDIKLYAQGGKVKGPGGPKEDKIAAKVPSGSIVVPAENSEMAEALRASFLAKKSGSMKPAKKGVPVKVSNGEHMFTPKEKKQIDAALIQKGMDPTAVWNKLIPNPDPGNELSSGGIVTADTTGTKKPVTIALNPVTEVMTATEKKDAIDLMIKKRTSLPKSQQPILLNKGGKAKKNISWEVFIDQANKDYRTLSKEEFQKKYGVDNPTGSKLRQSYTVLTGKNPPKVDSTVVQSGNERERKQVVTLPDVVIEEKRAPKNIKKTLSELEPTPFIKNIQGNKSTVNLPDVVIEGKKTPNYTNSNPIQLISNVAQKASDNAKKAGEAWEEQKKKTLEYANNETAKKKKAEELKPAAPKIASKGQYDPLGYDKSKIRKPILDKVEAANKEKDPVKRAKLFSTLVQMGKDGLLNRSESNYIVQNSGASAVKGIEQAGVTPTKTSNPYHYQEILNNAKNRQDAQSAKYDLGVSEANRIRSLLLKERQKAEQELKKLGDIETYNPDKYKAQKEKIDEIDRLIKNAPTDGQKVIRGTAGDIEAWNKKTAAIVKTNVATPKPASLPTKPKNSTVSSTGTATPTTASDPLVKSLMQKFPTLTEAQAIEAINRAKAKREAQKGAIPTVTLPDQSQATASSTGTSTGTKKALPKRTTTPAATTQADASTIKPIMAPETDVEADLATLPEDQGGTKPVDEGIGYGIGLTRKEAPGLYGDQQQEENKTKLTPIQMVSMAQIAAGLLSANEERPLDTPSPIFVSRVASSVGAAEKAKEEAGYGFTYIQRQSIDKKLESNRRQAMSSILQTTSGASGVSQALRSLSQDKNAAAIDVEAKDAEIKMMKQDRADRTAAQADSMVGALESRKRQIFEDDNKAYWEEAGASAALIDSGLTNLFNSIEQRKIDKEREKRSN